MKSGHFKIDSTIFWVVGILVALGIVMVYSASSVKAAERFDDGLFFLKSHVLKALLGLVVMLIVARVDYRVWLKISPVLLLLALSMLIYLIVSPGLEAIRGSKRWLTLGSLHFQPSDLARIAVVLFLSAISGGVLFKNYGSRSRLLLCLTGLVAMLVPIVLQPDLGTAVLVACVGLGIIFVSGQKLRYLVPLALTAVPAGFMLLMNSGYQKARILQYMASVRGENLSWQTKQALTAFGNGGILGVGPGRSIQKYHFLPDPFTDFIFAIVGEELGFIGTMLVLGLMLVLIWRGFDIARDTPDIAGKVLGIGIVLNIAVYALANAGVAVNLLPTTGIPMPFLSYGGTALIVNLFGIGVLLNIANESRNRRLLYPINELNSRHLKTRLTEGGRLRGLTRSRRRQDTQPRLDSLGYSVLTSLRRMETSS